MYVENMEWSSHVLPVLVFHIVVGATGLLAGAAALSYRKGSRRHRFTGNAFFVAMLLMTATGALMAFQIDEFGTTIIGSLTFYLVATGWATVRRGPGKTERIDLIALGFVLAVGTIALTMGLRAPTDEGGGFYLFLAGVSVLFAVGDVRMLVRGGVTGAKRLARHLWRMCFALFVAALSFFFGQQEVFPEPVRESGVLWAPILAVLAVMFFWLFRVLWTEWYSRAGTPT